MTNKPEVKTADPETQIVKSPFALPGDNTIKAPSPFASKAEEPRTLGPVIATIPAPDPKPQGPAPAVIQMLLDLPEEIHACSVLFDTVTALYEARLSDLTFKAFSTMMFPGKKPDEPLRVASNDEERKVAVSQVIAADDKMRTIRRELDEASRELTLAKNKYESAKIVAHLLAAK